MVAKLKSFAPPKRKRPSSSSELPASKRKTQENQDVNDKKKKKKKVGSKARPFSKAQKDAETEFAGDDLEELGFGEETKHFFERGSSDDDQEYSDDEAERHGDGRLRMRPDITLDEPQYAGRQSSRKAFFEEEDGTGSDEMSDEDDAEVKGNQELSWDSDDIFENQHSGGEAHNEIQDDEMEALDKEYRELQAQEEQMLKGLRGRNEEEVLKGQAVKWQKTLWDKALEFRILLQKPFSSSNYLPLAETRSSMSSNAEVHDAYTKLTASSFQTLGCFTEALKALQEQNVDDNVHDDTSSHETNVVSGDDIESVWQQMSDLYSRFVPFRNSSVDRWQRKTQLSSGAAASKTKLRAFNQSISQQIENHLRDYSRMLQRMCLRRSSVNVIGMPVAAVEQNETMSNNNGSELKDENKDVDGDPELIDDTEFYQELLREFLESSDPASIGTLYAVRKLRNKKRKVVDRRASKGRKIRYNVHDKIVNFMAPLPVSMPPMAERLFTGGLFQAKVNHL